MKLWNTIHKDTMELIRKEDLFTLRNWVKLMLISCCKSRHWIDMWSTTYENLRKHLLISSQHVQLQQKSTLTRAPLFWMCREWYVRILTARVCDVEMHYISCLPFVNFIINHKYSWLRVSNTSTKLQGTLLPVFKRLTVTIILRCSFLTYKPFYFHCMNIRFFNCSRHNWNFFYICRPWTACSSSMGVLDSGFYGALLSLSLTLRLLPRSMQVFNIYSSINSAASFLVISLNYSNKIIRSWVTNIRASCLK